VPAITGIVHVSLSVRNLRASEAWYQSVFGFERAHAERTPQFNCVVLRLPDSQLAIGLYDHHGASTARFDETRIGLDHLAFAVADRAALEEWNRRLKEMGIDHSPISESSATTVITFRDPDHIPVELFCPKEVSPRAARPTRTARFVEPERDMDVRGSRRV
jgi:glyoxylase I family protein